MGRKEWGKAKLEVLANKSKIEKFAKEGLSHKEIFNILLGDKNISCAFRTFRRHARQMNSSLLLSVSSTAVPIENDKPAALISQETHKILRAQPSQSKILEIKNSREFDYNPSAKNQSWKEEESI